MERRDGRGGRQLESGRTRLVIREISPLGLVEGGEGASIELCRSYPKNAGLLKQQSHMKAVRLCVSNPRDPWCVPPWPLCGPGRFTVHAGCFPDSAADGCL